MSNTTGESLSMSAAISSKILDCCSQQIAVSPDLIAFSTMSKFLMHNSEYTFEHFRPVASAKAALSTFCDPSQSQRSSFSILSTNFSIPCLSF